MAGRISVRILFSLLVATLFSAVLFSSQLLYPTVTAKALWLRALVMLTLPVYVYCLLWYPNLRPSLRNPVTVALGAFALFSLVSGIWGVNPTRSFWGDYEQMGGVYHLLHLTLLYFYLLMLAKASDRLFTILLESLVWIGGLSSIYGILEAAGMGPWTPDVGLVNGRVSSFQGNPIFFASFLVLPLTLALYFWSRSRAATSRYLYIGLAIVQVIGIGLSGTRGAFVAVLAGASLAGILLALNRRSWRFSRTALWWTGGVGAGVVLLALVFHDAPAMYPLRRIANLQDKNASARLLLWRTALRGYKDHPLLGVGPENYYAVADKYSGLGLYRYASERLDKPHNYQIEVLVTTGLGGFLAYVGALLFMLLAIAKAYRTGRLSWGQGVILATGVVLYQVQNLFAFDTVAASLTFYIYAAFLAAMWPENERQRIRQDGPEFGRMTLFRWTACLAAAAFSVLVVYVTEGVTAANLYDLNYALVTGLRDVHSTKLRLDQAAESSFVYDRAAVAAAYEQFAVGLVEDKKASVDAAFANSVLDASIAQMEQAAEQTGNRPGPWSLLANLYSEKAHFNKAAPDLRAGAAIQKAMELAPNRIEPLYYLVQYDVLGKRLDDAQKVAEQIVRMAPEDGEARWVLAEVDRDLGKNDLAVHTAVEAVRLGYQIKLLQEFSWLIDYYAGKQDFKTVADLYGSATKLEPRNSRLYTSLAATYAQLGEKDKARAAAQKALSLNPALEADVRMFLHSLQ